MRTPNIVGALPPPQGGNIFFVEPIKAGQTVKCRIWSPAVWGVWTHYHNATSPCYEDHNRCVEGHDPKTLRWKGYLLGWNYKENRPTFFQLTGTCVEGLFHQLPEGITLRGASVSFTRTAKGNGRLRATWNEYETVDPTSVGKDCDPRTSLYNTWKLPDHGYKWTMKPILRLADMGETG